MRYDVAMKVFERLHRAGAGPLLMGADLDPAPDAFEVSISARQLNLDVLREVVAIADEWGVDVAGDEGSIDLR